MQADFENDILNDVDNIALYQVYADWLIEQGDPRGEFIQVQLMLETGLTPDEHDQWSAREDQLIQAHQETWLGLLLPYVTNHDSLQPWQAGDLGPEGFSLRYRRGFPYELNARQFTLGFGLDFLPSPAARYLQRLSVDGVYFPRDGGYTLEMQDALSRLLSEGSRLENLRYLRVGAEDEERCFFDSSSLVPSVVELCPRLQSLQLYSHQISPRQLFTLPMPLLQELSVFHETLYPVHLLADNPSLQNLQSLRLQPHAVEPWDDPYLTIDSVRALAHSPNLQNLKHLALRLCTAGDEGLRLLVDAGWHRQLHVLDLRHGNVTDEGVLYLARHFQGSTLQRLDFINNALTADGMETLHHLPLEILLGDQHLPDDQEYLFHGDME